LAGLPDKKRYNKSPNLQAAASLAGIGNAPDACYLLAAAAAANIFMAPAAGFI